MVFFNRKNIPLQRVMSSIKCLLAFSYRNRFMFSGVALILTRYESIDQFPLLIIFGVNNGFPLRTLIAFKAST